MCETSGRYLYKIVYHLFIYLCYANRKQINILSNCIITQNIYLFSTVRIILSHIKEVSPTNLHCTFKITPSRHSLRSLFFAIPFRFVQCSTRKIRSLSQHANDITVLIQTIIVLQVSSQMSSDQLCHHLRCRFNYYGLLDCSSLKSYLFQSSHALTH